MFDEVAFRAYIKERGLRLQTVAEAMGIDRTTLYRKMKGHPDFTLREIHACFQFFNDAEIQNIFFAEKVS